MERVNVLRQKFLDMSFQREGVALTSACIHIVKMDGDQHTYILCKTEGCTGGVRASRSKTGLCVRCLDDIVSQRSM